MAKVLVVDDHENVRDGVSVVLHRANHQVEAVPGGAAAIEALRHACPPFDLVVTDLRMEGVDGMDVLRCARCLTLPPAVVMMTAHGSVSAAVEAMREGADDFLEKPFAGELLKARCQRALAVREERHQADRLKNENQWLRGQVLGEGETAVDRLIGSSEVMASVRSRILKVAPTRSTVLILGESGTGKELVAAALHQCSDRHDGPFVRTNCSALSDALLESELFGHEKGAFTDAHRRKLGLFELADGGTLFLDEIGDISPAMQVRLLRVLQEQTVTRLGGERAIDVDVRVVAATNRDLEVEVAEGRFREDLFYRLHIIPIQLPPLRERRGDIEGLAQHFLEKLRHRTRSEVRRIHPQALTALESWDWPGNVRELENCIEQALVFAEADTLELALLPDRVRGVSNDGSFELPPTDRPLPEILDTLEKRLILRAWNEADGVKAETARLLGIKPSALYYKLEKYGIGDAPPSDS